MFRSAGVAGDTFQRLLAAVRTDALNMCKARSAHHEPFLKDTNTGNGFERSNRGGRRAGQNFDHATRSRMWDRNNSLNEQADGESQYKRENRHDRRIKPNFGHAPRIWNRNSDQDNIAHNNSSRQHFEPRETTYNQDNRSNPRQWRRHNSEHEEESETNSPTWEENKGEQRRNYQPNRRYNSAARNRPRFRAPDSLDEEFGELRKMGIDANKMNEPFADRWGANPAFAMPEMLREQSEKEEGRTFHRRRFWRVRRTMFPEHKHREPNLLTFAAKEQIKFLNNLNPERWTPQQISESFPISEQGARQLLRIRSFYTDMEHIKKHDEGVKERWKALKTAARNDGEDAVEGGPVVSVDQIYRYSVGELSMQNAFGIQGLGMPKKISTWGRATASPMTQLASGKFSQILLKYVKHQQNQLIKKNYPTLSAVTQNSSTRQIEAGYYADPSSSHATPKSLVKHSRPSIQQWLAPPTTPASDDSRAVALRQENGSTTDAVLPAQENETAVHTYLGYKFDEPVNPDYIRELLEGYIDISTRSGDENEPRLHNPTSHSEAKNRIMRRVRRSGNVEKLHAYEEYFARKDWETEQKENEALKQLEEPGKLATSDSLSAVDDDDDVTNSPFFQNVPKFASHALDTIQERAKARFLLLEKRASVGRPNAGDADDMKQLRDNREAGNSRDRNCTQNFTEADDDNDDGAGYNVPLQIYIPKSVRESNTVYKKFGALYDANGKFIRKLESAS